MITVTIEETTVDGVEVTRRCCSTRSALGTALGIAVNAAGFGLTETFARALDVARTMELDAGAWGHTPVCATADLFHEYAKKVADAIDDYRESLIAK